MGRLLLIPIILLRVQPARAASEFSAGATFTRITTGRPRHHARLVLEPGLG